MEPGPTGNNGGTAIILLPLLLGPFIGSFLGVLIRRLPSGRPVALARSACETCGARLTPIELIPLISHLRQRGLCRHCGASIPPFHWHVELAATTIPLAALLPFADDPARLWLATILGWWLLALAWIDATTLRLPDALTLPLIPAGLLAAWWLDPSTAWLNACAVVIAYCAFRAIAIGYRTIRHREGLGRGDAKLLAALAAWVGLDALPLTILGAALLGLAAALAMRLRGQKVSARTALPFGPCLSLAAWLLYLHL